MRILHIMAGRGLGGAETYASDIMLSLHDHGVDQCVVMADDAPRYPEIVKAGIRTAPEVLRPRLRFFQRRALDKVLTREKPDLVHCWMRRAASLMPRWDKERVIGWFGGYYDPRHFTSCGHFIGVTKGITAHMVENGVPTARANYVPTFPDVKDEPPTDRASLVTPTEAFVVLALSRLHPKKGLDTLIRAVWRTPGIYLWLAGEGPLRCDLEKLVRELDMESRVRFLGWRMDRGALLRAADVCSLPSRYEPFGTVILEAWAAGTPFVACKSAGPSATVEHERNGLLVDIDDVEGLAAALVRLRDDDALRQKLIAGGRETYLAGYTRVAVTARMLEVYRKILGRA